MSAKGLSMHASTTSTVVVAADQLNAAEAIGLLDAARQAVGDAVSKTGEVIANYADALCAVFGRTWFELKGKEAKGIRGERAKFVEMMLDRGVAEGSVDKYWQRVKEASGYQTAGNRVTAVATPDQKVLGYLRSAINLVLTCEDEGVDLQASDYKDVLIETFLALGGKEEALDSKAK